MSTIGDLSGVHWGMFSTSRDIMIHVGDYHEFIAGMFSIYIYQR